MGAGLILLPVHGFVLAGGRSLRMGQDKALLVFDGQPLIERAVAKLREVFAEVSIAGNRDDLASYAAIVQEARLQQGPTAGVEAALLHARHDWIVCIPVDAPLVPAVVLRRWVEALLQRAAAGVVVSYLRVDEQDQPAFCAVHRSVLPALTAALDHGDRRLLRVLQTVAAQHEQALGLAAGAGLFVCAVESLLELDEAQTATDWFANLNTPEELAAAQQRLQTGQQNRLQREGREHRIGVEAKP